MSENGKKRSKVIPLIIGLTLLSLATPYILDKYVFVKKTGVYFTKKPSLAERIFGKDDEEAEELAEDESVEIAEKEKAKAPKLVTEMTNPS